jgi:hypothetical protein
LGAEFRDYHVEAAIGQIHGSIREAAPVAGETFAEFESSQ